MKLKEIKEIAKELRGKKNVLICYSTGVDSSLLLYLVKEAADTLREEEKKDLNLRAVYFYHGENEISQGGVEAINLAMATCKELKMPLDIYDLKLEKTSLGWEGEGRKKRKEIIDDIRPDLVFTGHHKMDRMENILIQLFRGAGRGINGLKKHDQVYYRPLIAWTKDKIYSYAKKFNLKWREDPTNKNSDMTRNFWRTEVIPKLSEHYTNLEDRVIGIAKRVQEQQLLNYDLAVIDGLNNLGTGVDVSKLPKERIFNLLRQYSYLKNTGLKQNQLEETYKRWNNGHPWAIRVGEETLNYKNGIIKIENKNKPSISCS